MLHAPVLTPSPGEPGFNHNPLPASLLSPALSVLSVALFEFCVSLGEGESDLNPNTPRAPREARTRTEVEELVRWMDAVRGSNQGALYDEVVLATEGNEPEASP